MLIIDDLHLKIGGKVLLSGASLNLPTGARAGLVGANGAGKSTLFSVITGDFAPESGDVRLPRNVRIGQVAQEVPGSETALIDIVLAADKERASLMDEAETATDGNRIAEIHTRLADIEAHAAPARAAAILAGLGFDEEAQNRPASSFSGGWRMRVALAATLFVEPDLLLLDEPTNYLDLEGTLWLQNHLKTYPHTALIISHDRDLLNETVNQIVHFQDHSLTLYRGNYDNFARTHAQARQVQIKTQEKQADKKAHMEAFVARFRAKASKARQAQSRLKALQKLGDITVVADDNAAPFRFPEPEKPVASPIIAMENASVGYVKDSPVLSELDLRIDHDDRIALLGTNGNGKSTLAKLIAERLSAQDGRIVRAPNLRIAYFAQHQLDELQAEESAVQHVRALAGNVGEAGVRSKVAQMGLSTEKMDRAAKLLSGGEKARLMMGIAAYEGAHLLILDEPTNHLDMQSREALMEAINDFKGAVILISHDRHLIEMTADRLWLVEGGSVKPFDGDIEAYRDYCLRPAKRGKQAGETAAPRPDKATQRKEAASQRAALSPLKQKIRETEKLTAFLERKIGEVDQRLGDPASYEGSSDKTAQDTIKRADMMKALMEAEEIWLKLSSEYETLLNA